MSSRAAIEPASTPLLAAATPSRTGYPGVMRILVTGGSSFVGAHLCRVAADTHEVHALFHSCPVHLNRVSAHRVDLTRSRDIRRLQALSADAVVHVACRIQARPHDGLSPAEAAAVVNRRMMDGVLALGLPTVYASSTVVHWNTDTPYGRSRREDEERLAESGLPYAILRPSAPYGPALASHQPRHTESFHTLLNLVRRSPLVPVVGSGQQRRQPIHVEDFARAVLNLLEAGLPNKAFDAGGSTAHTLREIIALMGKATSRRPLPLPLPKALFVQAARMLPDFDPTLMSAADEDELADPTELARAVGFMPRGFADGVHTLVSA